MDFSIFKFERRLSLFLLLIILIAASSCGQKNQVQRGTASGSNSHTPGFSYFSMSTFAPITDYLVPQVEAVKAAYPCKSGGQRLNYQFYVPLTGQLAGQWQLIQEPTNTQPTQVANIPSGLTVAKVYMGLFPAYNDLLWVGDAAQGGTVVGKFLTLGLCEMHPIILPNRPLKFAVTSPIILTENPTCVIGNAKGNIRLASDQFGYYPAFDSPVDVFINFQTCPNSQTSY